MEEAEKEGRPRRKGLRRIGGQEGRGANGEEAEKKEAENERKPRWKRVRRRKGQEGRVREGGKPG